MPFRRRILSATVAVQVPCNESGAETEASHKAMTQHARGLIVSIDNRMAAKIAGVGAGALAAAVVCAPGALADPSTPVPPPPNTVDQAAAPGPVPHLSSPQNLPPGTSDTPVAGTEPAGVSYARSVWDAIQDHSISWGQGLLLLAQRPMDPNAAPPPGLAAGPQQPGPAVPPPATP
jgi:hypothetical protein